MGANARFKLLEARKLDTPTLPRQKHIERSGEKLDINSTPCISNFIKKSTGIFKRGPDVTSNGKTYPTWYDGKFRYMDEDNHWDIQYPAPAYCTKPAPQGCGRKPLRHPEPGIVMNCGVHIVGPAVLFKTCCLPVYSHGTKHCMA